MLFCKPNAMYQEKKSEAAEIPFRNKLFEINTIIHKVDRITNNRYVT